MAVFHEDYPIVTLPEFAHLKGVKMPYDNTLYDYFQGGLGAVKGQPVSATPKSDLLRPTRTGTTTMHEFAHAIQNLCFTPEDHETWNALYDAAAQTNVFHGLYLMTNPDEFFAELSVSYIVGGRDTWTEAVMSDAFAFLERIYSVPSH